MKFYLTFSSTHPLRDNWIEVEATNEEKARKVIYGYFKLCWAMLYTEKDFKPTYFSGGRVGKVLKGE